MNEPTIICPSCKTEIKLTESLALPLIESTRKEYEQKIHTIQVEIGSREQELAKERTKLAEEREHQRTGCAKASW